MCIIETVLKKFDISGQITFFKNYFNLKKTFHTKFFIKNSFLKNNRGEFYG